MQTPQLSNKNTGDDDSITENSKRKENNIKLQEVVYEILGKAWPSSKKTQGKRILYLIKSTDCVHIRYKYINICIFQTTSVQNLYSIVNKYYPIQRDLYKLLY